tara:strand:- start:47634 stop:49418 length:1785 start_codon:yes stop_codon:yes gene_type:complete
MAKVDVIMPQMGESVMEGTVIEWAKQIGDTVEVDETLLEIATDKVDSEVPSPEAGVLVEILVEEGETIEVGKPIARIETDATMAPESITADPTTDLKPTPTGTTKSQQFESQTISANTAPQGSMETVDVIMPQMGESVVEATVIGWMKKVGDPVEEDETILEISTDKVDSEVPSPVKGILLEIRAEADDIIEVGQIIAVIGLGDGVSNGSPTADISSVVPPVTQLTKEQIAAMKPEELSAQLTPSAAVIPSDIPREGSAGQFFSPLVRSIAKKEGVSAQELEGIQGTGQAGRVTKNDILSYIADRSAGAKESSLSAPFISLTRPGNYDPSSDKVLSQDSKDSIQAGQLDVSRSPKEEVEIIKMDRMRKMISEHMVRSKQTSAHVTTFAEVDVTSLVQWRNKHKQAFQQKTGVKLTFTPLFVEAIIKAMLEYPMMNSSVVGDEIHVKKDINFGIAVALGKGGEGGLIVPVMKKAQQMNLVGLAEEVNNVAQKARSKKLSPDDLAGGTITLTNYGSVGNLMGTPIINQPQVAIIGTGAIVKRPMVMETEQGDVIAVRHMMYLSMSYDHRIIDGAHGGAFVSRVKEILEQLDVHRDI